MCVWDGEGWMRGLQCKARRINVGCGCCVGISVCAASKTYRVHDPAREPPRLELAHFEGERLCIYVYIYMCVYMYMYMCVYVCICMCIYVCIYVYIYVYKLGVLSDRLGVSRYVRRQYGDM